MTAPSSNLTGLKAMFQTFGCKLNFSETSTVASLLAAEGIRRIAPGEEPDVIIINTCSVTDVADKKCRQAIRSLAHRHPGAGIFVTGCYSQLQPSEAAALPDVVAVVGNDRKHHLADHIRQWKASREVQCAQDLVPGKDFRQFEPSCSRGDRTRYFLKVQDGCDYYCSYCTIPFARGRSRSGTVDGLVNQARQVAEDGGKEIVLTGVNIGDFGKGRAETLLDLIKQLDCVDGIERYRISSIEPDLLTDEIIDFVAQSRAFMPHFHIPLQSGDDAVLKLMRRHYDTALFRHKIERIRSVMPHAFIGVDLIAGLRGETPERYESSRDFVQSLPVSRLHVFPYSERPGTRALEISPVVEEPQRRLRAMEMIELSNHKLRQFTEPYLGTVRPVLVEHRRPGHRQSGFTDNYIKVMLEGTESISRTIANTIVPVLITGFDSEAGAVRGRITLM